MFLAQLREVLTTATERMMKKGFAECTRKNSRELLFALPSHSSTPQPRRTMKKPRMRWRRNRQSFAFFCFSALLGGREGKTFSFMMNYSQFSSFSLLLALLFMLFFTFTRQVSPRRDPWVVLLSDGTPGRFLKAQSSDFLVTLAIVKRASRFLDLFFPR